MAKSAPKSSHLAHCEMANFASRPSAQSMTLRQRRLPPARTATIPSQPITYPKPPPQRPLFSPSLRLALLPLLAAYTTVLLLLILHPHAQRHLTYLHLLSQLPIFPPQTPLRYRLHGRHITINHIHAWHIPPPHPPATNFTASLSAPRQRVIIYHHGNSGTRAWPRRVEGARLLAHSFHAHVITFDYSGFGDTPGSPSEPQLYADSEAVYHWVVQHTTDADVWLYGQSLGTFPAVELGTRLCGQLRPRGVLLDAPPASLVDAAMTHPSVRLFRIFPSMRQVLEAVLWEKLDNVRKIGNVCLPLLIMHGDRDDMIPIEQGESLYQAAKMAGVDAEFVRFEGYGHKDINAAPEYLRVLQRFMDRYASVKVPVREVGKR